MQLSRTTRKIVHSRYGELVPNKYLSARAALNNWPNPMLATPMPTTLAISKFCVCAMIVTFLPPGNLAIAADPTVPAAYSLTKILPPLRVSSSQKIAQQTPIATHDGYVYIVNVEAGESGDENGINLHTVIRRGEADQEQKWSWQESTLDTHTIYDPWHTSPAVGVDNLGYIHVAYNMHNFPWQYSVSDQPNSISGFTFLGDEISLEKIRRAKYENKTSFKTHGYSSIPGNQITYPAFYSDSAGTLYVTYRFAAKPARNFELRTMSAAVARHDFRTKKWQSLGGNLRSEDGDYKTSWFKNDLEPLAVASQEGWTAYHPRLAFDNNNRAFIYFFWREGTAGETLVKPCIITTVNFQQFTTLQGEIIHLPVRPKDCSNISTEINAESTYNTIGSITADANGSVHIIVSPTNQARKILTFTKGAWFSEPSPDGATEIFVDQWNNFWSISSGLNVFRKSHGDENWKRVIEADEKRLCYPKVALNGDKNTAYIYSQSCDDSNTVSVHTLELTPDS